MHTNVLIALVFIFLALRLLWPCIQSTISPLRSVPGPLWTRFSTLWFFRKVQKGSFDQVNISLHRKYGPIVRVAPNMYSIDDPAAIKTIYGINSKFPKSEWYEGWKHPDPARFTLFPDRNIERHGKTRRLFQGMYALSSLVTYESYVDECAAIFSKRLTEFSRLDQTIDMGHWFQCYAFDVIGDITYGERFRFLDAGEDIAGTMAALQKSMVFSTLAGIYASWCPWVYYLMERLASSSGPAGRTYLMNFVTANIRKRREQQAGGDKEKFKMEQKEDSPRDFLSKILQARQDDPEKVSEWHVSMMGLSNIIAGSDTTAVSLSAMLYYLMKNSRTMLKLREEIGQFEEQGKLGKDRVGFKESQEMPYFQAVMKEALRMHAATGLPLWRVVPEGGAEISGRFWPAGTVLGVNTWVAHYNEEVYGPDAKEFRPERWIEAEKEGGGRLKRMDAYYMPFGLGSRTCLGRHISILEMSKLIPQIIRKFDFELEHPEKQWTTENYWFVKPVDFRLKVKIREGAQKT